MSQTHWVDAVPAALGGTSVHRFLSTISSRSGLAVVCLTTLSLFASGAPAIADPIKPVAASAETAPEPNDSDGDGAPDRPNRVSAMAAAESSKTAVEDLASRTPSTSLFANPDGSWTTEASAGVTRVQDADGNWVAPDPTVVRGKGKYEARAAAGSAAFADGGGKTVGKVATRSGAELSISWLSALPAPTVSGNRLTYTDAAGPGRDLVVTSLAEGFNYSVVLRRAPDSTGPVRIRVPLNVAGGEAKIAADGSAQIVDDGKTVATVSTPIMWAKESAKPASTKPTEETATPAPAAPSSSPTSPSSSPAPEQSTPEPSAAPTPESSPASEEPSAKPAALVEADPTPTPSDSASASAGDSTDGGAKESEARDVRPVAVSVDSSGGSPVLTYAPDMDFLTDPSTVYPVTIDPTVSVVPTTDTWVEGLFGQTSSQSTSPELRVGPSNSGLAVARSYLQFDLSSWAGVPAADITSAKLHLSNFETGSCAGTPVTVSRVSAAWTASSINYLQQPATVPDGAASTSEAHGAAGCPDEATVDFNVLQIVTAWLGGAANYGVQIKSADESAVTAFRKYRSSENGSPAKAPTLEITSNTTPSVPTASEVEPALTVSGNQVSSSSRPRFASIISDPDAGQVTPKFRLMQGSNVVYSATLDPVPSGSRVVRQPATDIADGTYVAQWQADDGSKTSAWSSPVTVVIDTVAPAAPTISCSGTANNAWYDTAPGPTTTCTITVAAGTDSLDVSLNRANAGFRTLSGNSTTETFNVPADGVFDLRTIALDQAGNGSTSKYFFGVGSGALTSPAPGLRSTALFTVGADSKAGALSANLQWRYAGTSTWNTATAVKQGFIGWTGLVSTQGSMALTGDLTWDASAEAGMTTPSALEARFCFVYSGGAQRCTAQTAVNLVAQAFGGSFPTATVGPAQVALQSGKFQLSGPSATVPGFGDDLSFGATYSSFAVAGSAAQGVFGPGWTVDLDGPTEGYANARVVDNTAANGTISLLGSGGDTATYQFASGGTTAQAVGVYTPVGENAADNDKLEIKSGSPKTMELTEADGTVTTWSNASSNQWNVSTVLNPTGAPATTYSYDGSGFVTGMYAGIPGLTQPCSSAAQIKGCHAMLFNYNTTSSGQRLSDVSLKTWDPAANSGAGAMTTTVIQKYTYDSSDRLASYYDPRLDSGGAHLQTTFTYQQVNGKTYLATATEPGQKPWQFTINSDGTLDTVSREQDSAVGGTATWKIRYNIGLSGSGLPNLTEAAVDRWWQRTAPEDATAVFGPDATDYNDMTYADITYFTRSGVTTNTASYGAGAWQISSVAYDQLGNKTWQLTPEALAWGLKVGWNKYGLNFMLSTRTWYNATGTRPELVLEPDKYMIRDDGTQMYGRRRTEYVYDDEAAANGFATPGRPTPSTDPNAPKPDVLVAKSEAISTADGEFYVHPEGTVYDKRWTYHRYDKVVSSDGDGWKLKIPTRVTEAYGTSLASTSLTRFDSYGQVTETRTPGGVATTDGPGSDAKSTITNYFTVDGSSPISGCRNHPEWLSLVCQTGPAASSGADPTTTNTSFDYQLNPKVSVETSGAMTRTSTTTYDAAGRMIKSEVSMAGAPSGDIAVADTTYAYSQSNGMLQSTTQGSNSVNVTYDTWGRELTHTDGAGNTATTTYDSAGRVKTFNDGKGTTTYTYDGNDASGLAERRGLITKLDTGLPSGPTQFNAAYDAGANMTTMRYPNGVVAANTFDVTGERTQVVYSLNGAAFMSDANYPDRDGRTRINGFLGASRTYTYDILGRLTSVKDQNPTCTIRDYTFAPDSERLALKTTAANTDGTCGTTATTVNSTFAADSRITNTGYTYDDFGRTRSLPAVDTDQPTGSALAVNYDSNDMVAKLAQTTGGQARIKTYTTDPLGRLSQISTNVAGTDLSVAVDHYSDNSDSPDWVATQSRATASDPWKNTWERYVASPAGDMGIIQESDGTSNIQVTNLHGDIVATMANKANLTSAALDHFTFASEYGLTEAGYGNPATQYGWLGAKQRSNDSIGGLVLMGVRLYNPRTGLFLTQDPVPGGSDNPYTYPVDPVNMFDLDGRKNWKKWLKKHGLDILFLALLAVPFVGEADAVFGGVRLAALAKAARVAPRVKGLVSGWRSGRELSIGKYRFSLGNKAARLSNGSANRPARLPHYHVARRDGSGRVRPGQGASRHRPWESKPTDKSWRDRF
ncbi:MAG: RHS repeat-associated core domain-containing protein [Aeromicrobium sp.]